MIKARDQANKFVSIGYQLSFSEEIQNLKRDIRSGIFGKPKRFKSPRSENYYSRGWAGKMKDNQGNIVMDSVSNNATSHQIHNMFYVLGNAIDNRPV
jgi:predicted dehydrogenase